MGDSQLSAFGSNKKASLPAELSKDEINQLPLRRYEGEIQLIRDRSELPEALTSLKNETLLGFDTETRPAFRKGVYYPPALLQLAGASAVYLFQISVLGFPSALRGILSDARFLKVGVGLHSDLPDLVRLAHFEPSGFHDLSEEARRLGLRKSSLRALTAGFLGFRIGKGPKTSNWGARHLSDSQVTYAATDAWVSREVYLRMNALDHL